VTVYVDPAMDHGWILSGRRVDSCHLFTELLELDELHRIARQVGCKPAWFQDHALPHYDLTIMRRQEAIGAGAVPVTRRQAVEIWRARRRDVDELLRLWSGHGLTADTDKLPEMLRVLRWQGGTIHQVADVVGRLRGKRA
jgi:hypothetical protein